MCGSTVNNDHYIKKHYRWALHVFKMDSTTYHMSCNDEWWDWVNDDSR